MESTIFAIAYFRTTKNYRANIENAMNVLNEFIID